MTGRTGLLSALLPLALLFAAEKAEGSERVVVLEYFTSTT
jgi:hypothetical protein